MRECVCVCVCFRIRANMYIRMVSEWVAIPCCGDRNVDHYRLTFNLKSGLPPPACVGSTPRHVFVRSPLSDTDVDISKMSRQHRLSLQLGLCITGFVRREFSNDQTLQHKYSIKYQKTTFFMNECSYIILIQFVCNTIQIET